MDWLEAVGDRELRTTYTDVLAQARPVTADDVAASQATHRNVARSRLERLADAGLLIRGYERRSGRAGPGAGRPAKTYSVAPRLRSIADAVATEKPSPGAWSRKEELGHLIDSATNNHVRFVRASLESESRKEPEFRLLLRERGRGQ